MPASKPVEWLLRLLIFGAFASHSAFLIQTKPAWIGWFEALMGFSPAAASHFLFLVAVIELGLALAVLILPLRLICLAASFWAALMLAVRPIPFTGHPIILEFIEHSAYWVSPLLLLALRGWPRSGRELLT